MPVSAAHYFSPFFEGEGELCVDEPTLVSQGSEETDRDDFLFPTKLGA